MNNTIRKTTATWEEFNSKTNTIDSKTVDVEYYGITVKEIKASEEAYNQRKKDGQKWYVSDTLAKRLHKLDGKEVKLDWLEEQEVKNLLAVEAAINDDENPPEKK